MNVVLCRVLYAHALVAAPRLSLGWLRPLAPLLGDPRLGMTGIFLQLSRVLPDRYPLPDEAVGSVSDDWGFGRLLDLGMIVPRVQQLYEWSAHELDQPELLDCIHDGNLTYARPAAGRNSWPPVRSITVQLVRRALPPERQVGSGGRARSLPEPVTAPRESGDGLAGRSGRHQGPAPTGLRRPGRSARARE
jgi:hypothetical protein